MVLDDGFKGYIKQFEAVAMPLTNSIARPIIEMPREALTIASGYIRIESRSNLFADQEIIG